MGIIVTIISVNNPFDILYFREGKQDTGKHGHRSVRSVEKNLKKFMNDFVFT